MRGVSDHPPFYLKVMEMRRPQDGFTLIELMIVVAIIGILAIIAAGEFLSYQAKSKQTEAKINLGAIAKMAEAYRAEHDTYVANVADLGWKPVMVTRYRYWYSGSFSSNTPSNTDAGVDYSDPGSAASPSTFTAFAVGNIDNDPGRDVWSFNTERLLRNNINDVSSH